MSLKDELRRQVSVPQARQQEFAKFQNSLKLYREVSRNGINCHDLLFILRRYNSVWESTTPIEIEDFPGFVRFFESTHAFTTIKPFLSQSFFYRMNFILQLSTIHLWTSLEAAHSRLAHSLGTVQVAELFLNSLSTKVEPELKNWERKAVLIYAFIHDCYHGPMGHSLELMHDVFAPGNYRGKLDKFFLSRALSESNSPLHLAISAALGEDPDKENILSYLSFFCNKREGKKVHKERYFLAQIVDSNFDADRIDYIFRDSHLLGLPEFVKPNKVFDAIERATTVNWKEEASRLNLRGLAFAAEDKATIEKLLTRRRELYLNYYERRSKLIVDEMLCRALYYLLREKSVFPVTVGPLFEDQQKVISEISRLTDADLFHFAYEAGAPLFSQLLIRDILSARFYCEVHFADLAEESAARASKLADLFEGQIGNLKKRKAEQLGSILKLSEVTHEEKLGILRNLVKEQSFTPQDVMWYFMFVIWMGGFTARLRIERLLWNALLSITDFREVVRKYYFQKLGPLENKLEAELFNFPLVHLSVPTYVSNRVREIREYAKELNTETMLFRDASGKAQPLELKLGEGTERSVLFVMLSAPSFFKSPSLRPVIQKTFEELVSGFKWADIEWLNNLPH
jgi:HD superfamily phosphohydrolase